MVHLEPNLLRELHNALEQDCAFKGLVDTIFTAVCPCGITAHMRDGDKVVEATRWFEELLNQVWIYQLKKALRQVLMYGFFIVTYEKSDASYARDPVPKVLDAVSFPLCWSASSGGRRKYYAQISEGFEPVYRRLNVPRGNHDVFFTDEPTDGGALTSKGKACLANVVALRQMKTFFTVGEHNRTHPPFVLFSATTADAAAGARRDGDSGACSASFIDEETPEQSLGLQHLSRATRTICAEETRSFLARHALGDASAKAALTKIRVVDETASRVHEVTSIPPWEVSPLVLPGGLRLAEPRHPEHSTHFIDMARMYVAELCTLLGVPSELMLGHVRDRVSSSPIVYEQFESTVWAHRSFLMRAMRRMYERIYADSHAVAMRKAADAVSPLVVRTWHLERLVEQTAVEFQFRLPEPDYDQARALYIDGVIGKRALINRAVVQYGLSGDDVDEDASADRAPRRCERLPPDDDDAKESPSRKRARSLVRYGDAR